MIKKQQYYFPPVENADKDGLLAMGGDLSSACLLEAYHSGIFPWYNEGEPILWWSPNPRMVLFPEELRISKSMRQLFNQQKFNVTINSAFQDVIRNCATISRNGQKGTWISEEMITAYTELYKSGDVLSVEVWEKNELVGGLYGVYLKKQKIFCGESMFSKVSNASKYGFISLIEKLKEEGIRLIDCQTYTKHLASLGGRLIPREDFLVYLKPVFD